MLARLERIRTVMKQYTTFDQTAKLIELGFREPKSKVDGKVIYEPDADLEIEWEKAYSIGELIEMLPREYDGEFLEILAVSLTYSKWTVRYPYGIIINKKELIDALYDMIINLKEEGVI
jgi:hypothetical protein